MRVQYQKNQSALEANELARNELQERRVALERLLNSNSKSKQAIQARLRQVDRDIVEANKDRDRLQREVAGAQDRIGFLTARTDTLSRELESTRSQLDSTRNELAAANTSKNDLRTSCRSRGLPCTPQP